MNDLKRVFIWCAFLVFAYLLNGVLKQELERQRAEDKEFLNS